MSSVAADWMKITLAVQKSVSLAVRWEEFALDNAGTPRIQLMPPWMAPNQPKIAGSVDVRNSSQLSLRGWSAWVRVRESRGSMGGRSRNLGNF